MDFMREQLIGALSDVGEILFQRKRIGDIAVFGGSAMMLQFDVSFVTQDVDAIICAEHTEVTRAVQEVARRRGWTSTWLNEGVSVYLSPGVHDHLFPFGDLPSPERVGLRVYVAKPEYLLALKLRALRIGSRDFDDVSMLARHLGLRTPDELASVVSRNFPDEPLDHRKHLMLSAIAKDLS